MSDPTDEQRDRWCYNYFDRCAVSADAPGQSDEGFKRTFIA